MDMRKIFIFAIMAIMAIMMLNIRCGSDDQESPKEEISNMKIKPSDLGFSPNVPDTIELIREKLSKTEVELKIARFDLQLRQRELDSLGKILIHFPSDNWSDRFVTQIVDSLMREIGIIMDSLNREINIRDSIIYIYKNKIFTLEQEYLEFEEQTRIDMGLLLEAQTELNNAVNALESINFFNKKRKKDEILKCLLKVKGIYETLNVRHRGILEEKIIHLDEIIKNVGA